MTRGTRRRNTKKNNGAAGDDITSTTADETTANDTSSTATRRRRKNTTSSKIKSNSNPKNDIMRRSDDDHDDGNGKKKPSLKEIESYLCSNILLFFTSTSENYGGDHHHNDIILSLDEAQGIAEATMYDFQESHDPNNANNTNTNGDGDDTNDETTTMIKDISRILMEYIPDTSMMTPEQIECIALASFHGRKLSLSGNNNHYHDDDNEESTVSSDNDDNNEFTENSDDNDDDDDEFEYQTPGECELCERENMKLTRHHLIPKSTWKKIINKCIYKKGESRRTTTTTRKNTNNTTRSSSTSSLAEALFLPQSIETLLPDISNSSPSTSSTSLKLFLSHYTSDVCRPCHSMIHTTFDNLELALDYNTIDKLLDDERIVSFCKWAHKQKSGKYDRSFVVGRK